MPDVATHEAERVCTSLGFRRDPFRFLLTSDQVRMIQVQMLVLKKKCSVQKRTPCDIGRYGRSRRWQSVGFCDKSCHFSGRRRIPWPPWMGESRAASSTPRLSNFEQMFADSRVILSVHSVGRKRVRSFSGASFFNCDAQP